MGSAPEQNRDYYCRFRERDLWAFDKRGTEVTSLIFSKDDVAWASWKYSEDNVAAGKNDNVAVAAYITTHARLKLYEYLSELGSLSCTVILTRWSFFRKIMTPKSENRGLSGRPHKWVGVRPWFFYSRVCVRWPKNCVFCFLPLDRKTCNKMKIEGYNIELWKFKGCKLHCFEEYGSGKRRPGACSQSEEDGKETGRCSSFRTRDQGVQGCL